MAVEITSAMRLVGVLLLLAFAVFGFRRAVQTSAPPTPVLPQLRPIGAILGLAGWGLLLASAAADASIAVFDVAGGRTSLRAGSVTFLEQFAGFLIVASFPFVVLMMDHRRDHTAPGSWLPPARSALTVRGQRYRALFLFLIGSGVLIWGVQLILRLIWR